jgi:hypothetical protein
LPCAKSYQIDTFLHTIRTHGSLLKLTAIQSDPSELFVNVRKRAAKDENLNETLEAVFKNIEGSALGADSDDAHRKCSVLLGETAHL